MKENAVGETQLQSHQHRQHQRHQSDADGDDGVLDGNDLVILTPDVFVEKSFRPMRGMRFMITVGDGNV